jgi:hypothetical protein
VELGDDVVCGGFDSDDEDLRTNNRCYEEQRGGEHAQLLRAHSGHLIGEIVRFLFVVSQAA